MKTQVMKEAKPRVVEEAEPAGDFWLEFADIVRLWAETESAVCGNRSKRLEFKTRSQRRQAKNRWRKLFLAHPHDVDDTIREIFDEIRAQEIRFGKKK